ncbi:MAG: hypothetical protein V3S39_02615, partial [Thermodesulfobacteriota bacterium]
MITLLAVIVGGLITYFTTRMLEKKREAENKRALANALRAELEDARSPLLNTPFAKWITENKQKIKNGSL